MLSKSRFLLSRKKLRISVIALVTPLLAGGVALVTKKSAHAEGAEVDKAEQSERCAIRLAIALTGKSPDAAQLAAPDPLAGVDGMVASPEFADRYARFINSEFNGGPSSNANDDPIYYLAKHVITQKKAWAELFLGPYQVTPLETAGAGMAVANNPNGLGYFRTPSWMKRYAGNEDKGLMLVAAFRIVQNTTGIELVPSVGAPGDDRTTTGRKADACKGCHFEAWFAIDTVANLLPLRKGQGDAITFTPATAGPQPLLGKTIQNDKELVESLVTSDGWRFNQCRQVFKFLYGRAENQCESKVFDACVAALDSQKTIQAAVAAVAKDASFCTN
ncbi:MAG: hypothetical protein K0S65_2106 [Labilithrix sp.]|nr:hypothetical protein [Labilithrix sp.]